MENLKQEIKIREIDKNKFKNIFCDGLNKEDPESIRNGFDNITDELLEVIGNKDFELRYKNAIINFGDWFISEFNTREFEDFEDFENYFDMPLIMMIYFDFVNDNIYSERNGVWNKYITMFNKNLENSTESKIANLAYINAYYMLRADSNTFVYVNIEPLVVFYLWFMNKYLDEKLEKVVLDTWNGEYPFIAGVVSDYLYDDEEEEKKAEEAIDELYDFYKNLSFSEKKNVNTLIQWAASLNSDKVLTFCSQKRGSIPLSFPRILKPEGETKEEYDMFLKVLRASCALLYEEDGIVLVSEIIDKNKQKFSGFLFYDRNIHVMSEEELENSVAFTSDIDVDIYFSSPDVFFVN